MSACEFFLTAINTLQHGYRKFQKALRRLLFGLLALSICEVLAASEVLMLVGNVLPLNNKIVWRNLVKIADRTPGENLVIAAAHNRPALYGEFALRSYQRYGETASLLPLAQVFQEFSTDYRHVVKDQDIVSRIRTAGSIFFVGGEPQRLSTVLFDRSGRQSDMAKAVTDAFRSGSLIVGGIPGHNVLSTESDVFNILSNATVPPESLPPGLGLISREWYVDQNMFGSGRFAGSLVAMNQLGLNFGIGIGLDTAAVVHQQSIEVLGNRGVLIIDLSKASFSRIKGGVIINNVILSYLENGDRVNMETMQVKPYSKKVNGFELTRQANTSIQSENDAFVSSQDVFRSGELVRLMAEALESDDGETLGYALHHGRRNGFIFRFYTDSDSRGWLATGSTDEDRYTLVNIRLDIRPIRGD